MLWIDTRELCCHKVFIVGGCYNPYMVNIYDSIKAVELLLNHGATTTRNVDKLLGVLWRTHRPKTGSYSTGHYH